MRTHLLIYIFTSCKWVGEKNEIVKESSNVFIIVKWMMFRIVKVTTTNAPYTYFIETSFNHHHHWNNEYLVVASCKTNHA
jgi:hypothetical protein